MYAFQKERKVKRSILFSGAALLALGALAMAAAAGRRRRTKRRPVASFDLHRYMGRWYEIARFQMPFEKGLDHVQARYELRPDGKVTVINSGRDMRTGKRREARGKAHATRTPGRLRVSFFWFFYSDYVVLDLGKNYEWSLVGSRSRKYLWILSRTPRLSERTLGHILRSAQRMGYPVHKLRFDNQYD